MRDGSVVVRLRLAPVLVLRWVWIGSLMICSQWWVGLVRGCVVAGGV